MSERCNPLHIMGYLKNNFSGSGRTSDAVILNFSIGGKSPIFKTGCSSIELFYEGVCTMTARELAIKIVVWIQEDIDEGECDPSEWIEDLNEYLKGVE